ncbi:MAG: SusC/RagA family TonB-linked outer membrane protein [Prevotella sp.]|jgi:TonB-linked SusC/RagA family outer membrane protein
MKNIQCRFNLSSSPKIARLVKVTGITCVSLFVFAPFAEAGHNGGENSVVLMSQQQHQKTVKGKVVDAQGEPLIGVTIAEKGTSNKAITDLDGVYTIYTDSATPTLTFSYVGYVEQNVKVGNRTSVDLTLQEDNQMLGEVIVQGFGIQQRKESLTGAISSINDKDVSRSLATTVSGALVGKVAGINSRHSDGRPGSSTSLQIRNMGTPLYVIDGVIKDEGQFNQIDQNDIEQISILKDASAAIYGVRAANGVVVVTTKHGHLNQPLSVEVNGYYGWQSMSRMAKPADAMTYLNHYVASESVLGVTRTYTKDDIAKWQQGTEKGYRPFDWYDFVFRTSPQTYISMNASGGSDKINYYFSIGNLKQEAIYRNYGGFYRTNVQMNIDAQVTSRLKVGASMNGRIEKHRQPGVPGWDDYWLPMFATYRNLPTRRPYANDNPKYPQKVSSEADTNFAILNYALSGNFNDKWRVAQLNGHADLDIGWGLKAQWLVGYYLAYQQLNNHEFTWKLYGYDEDTDSYYVTDEMNNPWRERRSGHVEELTSNLRLTFDRHFGDHHVAAILGLDASKRRAPSTWLHAQPAANAMELIYTNALDEIQDTGNNTEARLGWIGRFNYDYANKYLLEVSLRRDGAWKWAPDHRWGTFPAVSAGWRISEENFWQDSKLKNIFDDLKIRASYGTVGDDNVDGYSAYDYLSGYTYNDGGTALDGKYIIGSVARGLPATTFTWMKAHFLDIGIDYAFLHNRLIGTFDYFNRRRTGLPASRYDVLIPSEAGFSLPNENLNSDVRRGIDGSISWHDQWNDLKYSVGFNFTYARRYDWEQYKPRFSNSWDEYRNSLWHRFSGVFWGFESDGQFQTWDEIAEYPIDNDGYGNRRQRPGDIKYKDQNGDKIINDMDKVPIGYSTGNTPNFNYGFNFAFEWKGFDLAFDLTGGSGLGFMPRWEQMYPFHDGGNNPQYYLEDSWTLSDIWDANSKMIPGKYPMPLAGNTSHSNYWESDFWFVNVSYIKLRNFEFGYTLPKKWLDWAKISSLRLYVAGSNIFTITNKPGYDPEGTTESGLQYPTNRVVNVGFNLKF